MGIPQSLMEGVEDTFQEIPEKNPYKKSIKEGKNVPFKNNGPGTAVGPDRGGFYCGHSFCRRRYMAGCAPGEAFEVKQDKSCIPAYVREYYQLSGARYRFL